MLVRFGRERPPLSCLLLAALGSGCNGADAPRDAGVLSASVSSAAAAGSEGASRVGPAPAPAPPEGMVELPAAAYMMGSRTGSGDEEEHPMHEVLLAAFFLDRTEVTVDAYAACVEAGRCKAARVELPFCNAKVEGRGGHPINCVDHEDASAFCAFAGKRLPTESEWEYAASGGNEKRKFSWGEEEPDRARACYFHEGTCPVGSFAPGAFGLLDMSGNVWEWTSTFWGPYPGEPLAGTNRVYRGGSWSRRFPRWLRNTLRNRYPPDKWSAALGMRCARTRMPVSCPTDAEPQNETCIRMRGAPGCEPGFLWNGTACALSALAPPANSGTLPVNATSPPRPAENSPTAEPETIGRSRTPHFDDDCRSHYAGKTAAYAITGGNFRAREPVVQASGCTKRDVGRTWTSICCPE